MEILKERGTMTNCGKYIEINLSFRGTNSGTLTGRMPKHPRATKSRARRGLKLWVANRSAIVKTTVMMHNVTMTAK